MTKDFPFEDRPSAMWTRRIAEGPDDVPRPVVARHLIGRWLQ